MSPRRRLARAALAAALGASACSDAGPRDEELRRPNVLLIVADDLGVHDLGAYGNPDADTPRIDELAASGSRFTRFYAAGDVCAPTRASLMTGLHPPRLGFTAVPRGLPEEAVTLPEVLRDAGYATHHVGKWHLGEEPASVRPLGQGFDSFFGFLHARLLTSQGVPAYLHPRLVDGDGEPAAHTGHLTDLLTERAIATIRAGRDRQPWFVNLWYFAPHTPIQPPPRWAARYPDDRGGRYRALVAALDENVGRVLDALEETDQARDTIVLFLSDNGAPRPESNLPFFGAKTRLLEGGLRVPMILRAPGLEAPAVVEDTVVSTDVLPTLAALAGVELHHAVDGLDVTPLLRSPGGKLPERPLFWEGVPFAMNSAASLALEPAAVLVPPLGEVNTWSVLSADGRWRLSNDRGLALFDLVADPTGRRNVWRQHRELAESLASGYQAWIRRIRRIPVRAVARGDARWSGSRGAFSGEGRVDLVGYDVLRTPGRSWTFAVGIQPAASPDGGAVIAAQSEVWSLERDSAGRLSLRMGGSVLATERAPAAGACVGVAITSVERFSPARPAQPGAVYLVVDGRVAARGESTLDVPSAALARPTTLGDVEEGGRGFVGSLLDPTLLSAAVSLPRAEELSREVCAVVAAEGSRR